MTASLYTKGLLRPMDELVRALGEKDIHEATLKLQFFDGKYYGVTHAMGATYFAERRDLREAKGLKPPETYDDMLKLAAALTDEGKRWRHADAGREALHGLRAPGGVAGRQRRLVGRRQDLAAAAQQQVRCWRHSSYAQKLNKFMPAGLVGPEVPRHAGRAVHRQDRDGLSLGGPHHRLHRAATRRRTCARPRALHSRCSGPHGPQGKVGVSALDGENWAVFTQSKYPNESFEFLMALLQERALHEVLPLGADPPHARSSSRC